MKITILMEVDISPWSLMCQYGLRDLLIRFSYEKDNLKVAVSFGLVYCYF